MYVQIQIKICRKIGELKKKDVNFHLGSETDHFDNNSVNLYLHQQ